MALPWVVIQTLVVAVSLTLAGCGNDDATAPRTDAGTTASSSTPAGAVAFNGTVSLLSCARLDPVTATPLEISVGHSITLGAVVVASGSSSPAVNWLADNGWAAKGNEVKFPCLTEGTFEVTASLSEASGSCSTSGGSAIASSSQTVWLVCSEPEK
jgi:hypothetical protein